MPRGIMSFTGAVEAEKNTSSIPEGRAYIKKPTTEQS
jgi:hypothetical protein